MTILCIETSTSVCSAAVCIDGEPSKQCINYEGSNHARLLPLYIEQLLQHARENALSIDAVALSEGPGSYTGLRIGTSTAKGICYGLNIPLIPVPTLEILKIAAKEKITNHPYLQIVPTRGKESPITNYILMPMIDARRMEVYTMIDGETKAVVVENEDSLCSVSECNERSIYYFGDGAEKCSKIFTKSNWHYIPDIVPEAQYVGVLAEQFIKNQSQITNRQLAYYEPYYLKEFIAAPSHVKGLS